MLEDMIQYGTFTFITVWDEPRQFIASVAYQNEDGTFTIGDGYSTKSPEDKDNPARGEKLAVGRAMRDLGRKMLKEEYKAIHEEFDPKKKEITVIMKF